MLLSWSVPGKEGFFHSELRDDFTEAMKGEYAPQWREPCVVSEASTCLNGEHTQPR